MLPSHDWKREDKPGELEGLRNGLHGDRRDQKWYRDDIERAVEVGRKPELDGDDDLCRDRESAIGMNVDVEVKVGKMGG